MNFSRFFVDRPIFAAVLSIVITMLGGLAFVGLPIAQYPDVIPPTVVVTAVVTVQENHQLLRGVN